MKNESLWPGQDRIPRKGFHKLIIAAHKTLVNYGEPVLESRLVCLDAKMVITKATLM